MANTDDTYTSNTETPIEPPKDRDPSYRRHQRKIALTILAVVFIALLLLYLIYYLIWGQFTVYTDDAYVNGNIVSLIPQIPGTVTQIYADDTDLVVQGQIVVKLDRADTEIALQKASANLALTVRIVRQYFENAKQAYATLLLRKADLMKAELDVNRRNGLVGKQAAVSREELQHYQTTLKTAREAYNAALHRYLSLYSLVENAHLYTHPSVEKAKAQFKKSYLDLQRTTILAPVTGYVAKRNVNVGQQVNLTMPMLAIIPLSQVWVDANYKESQLSDIRIGQPVTLYADAFSNVTYHGRIVGLNAGTGAAFAILPPQNATGNWIKIVQRLPVRVSLDPKELQKHPLQLGLSMHATTNIRDRSGKRLPVIINKKPIYTTNVFDNQLAYADKLINRILEDNSKDMYLPRNDFRGGL